MARGGGGTIILATVGRSHFAFDLFSVDPHSDKITERLLTDGVSVNFNGQFFHSSDLINKNQEEAEAEAEEEEEEDEGVIYVSERRGNPDIYLLRHSSYGDGDGDGDGDGGELINSDSYPAAFDRPIVADGKVIYMSTMEAQEEEHKPWTGVYSTCLQTRETRKLTPDGVADYSPALSPSKKWIAVASNEGREWEGEVRELHTSLCVFRAEDGSQRRCVVERGGWPSWSDERTIFFHKKHPQDKWWSIYKLTLPSQAAAAEEEEKEEVVVERVTPPGLHAFTPAASIRSSWIAVATRRNGSMHRQIEIFDLITKSFTPVTEKLHPDAHHFNPFVSRSSNRIGYHRSRISTAEKKITVPLLQPLRSPVTGLTLLRIDGAFPSISPDGKRIAYNPDLETNEAGICISSLDGSTSKRIFSGSVFTTAWNIHHNLIYTSQGNIFASEKAAVHIISISLETLERRVLTKEGTSNNAFPYASPDGKHLVFRSGRSGHKNLYIMDAINGEDEMEGGSIRCLTRGAWIDTMPAWSPDGNWIAFSSTRDDESGNFALGCFALYLMHPDGTGVHRVLPKNSKVRSRYNHVSFSPDSTTLLFTGDVAGISAEPISVANQFQPYGELFICNLDGSDLKRLTHNAYEDGTPCWGKCGIEVECVSEEGQQIHDIQDCLWLN